jgi:release factor glutamine methyltransferase
LIAATSSTREALSAAVDAITAAGSDTARLDAELLLCEATGWDRSQLIAEPDLRLPVGASREFGAMVRRRVRREPVAYILGRKGFRYIEVRVDRRVLIPRPETEFLVEAALALPAGAAVLDVGTGSGAVALALKHERPDLRVSASDASPEAIEVARDNARRLRLDVAFRVADLLEGVTESAVVANLPYVADRDVDDLSPEIRRHEPALALAAGPDGLDVIRRLLDQTAQTRWLALEVGDGQAAAVRDLMASAGLEPTRTLRDLAGIERVVVGRRG